MEQFSTELVDSLRNTLCALITYFTIAPGIIHALNGARYGFMWQYTQQGK